MADAPDGMDTLDGSPAQAVAGSKPPARRKPSKRPLKTPAHRLAKVKAKYDLRKAERELAELEAQYADLKKRDTLLTDLVSFGRDVCGFADLNSKLHGSVAEFVESGPALVCLLPREHLKSSLITVAYTCQQIAKNPNIRVCIYTVTQDLAQAFLRQIKGVLKSERFQHWWGDRVSPDFEQETVDAITITRSKLLKEPTVYATSVGASQVGFHFDLNIYDDVVDNKTVLTDGAMAKTKQWYEESLALHEKNSKLIFIGTRWHDSDLAGELLHNDGYKHMVRSALEHGVPIFPEKFDTKRLARLKAQMSARTFSCQYLNDPVPESDQTFRESDLHEIGELPEGDTFIAIDPATGGGVRVDRTAIVVCRTDAFRRITIADIWIGRPDPGVLIEQIISMCEKWHPVACGLEKVAYQFVLQYFLQKEMIHSARYFPVTPLTPAGRHKEERIMALEPFLRSGKIWIWKQCPYRNELIYEMIRFPRGKSDDILDALAYQLDIVTFPSMRIGERAPMVQGKELLAQWLAWKHNDWSTPRKVLGTHSVRAS
jgi:hypothetical protein